MGKSSAIVKTGSRGLAEHQLFAKNRKCRFGCRQVDCIGHIIAEKGIGVVSKKIEIVVE